MARSRSLACLVNWELFSENHRTPLADSSTESDVFVRKTGLTVTVGSSASNKGSGIVVCSIDNLQSLSQTESAHPSFIETKCDREMF